MKLSLLALSEVLAYGRKPDEEAESLPEDPEEAETEPGNPEMPGFRLRCQEEPGPYLEGVRLIRASDLTENTKEGFLYVLLPDQNDGGTASNPGRYAESRLSAAIHRAALAFVIPEEWNLLPVSGILLAPDTDPLEFFTRVQRVFERFGSWETKTRQYLMDGRDLSETLSLCRMVTRCTVQLLDVSMRMLAHSSPTLMDEVSAIWMYHAKYGYLPINILNKLVESGELKEISRPRRAMIPETKAFNMNYTSRSIYVQNQLRAHLFLIAIYTKPMQVHCEIANVLGDMLVPEVSRNPFFRSSGGGIYESFFRDLLSGNITSSSWIRDQIAIFGWKPNDVYLAMKIGAKDETGENPDFAVKYLGDTNSTIQVFRTERGAAAVCHPKNGRNQAEDFEKFANLCERLHLCAAVSHPFRGIENLGTYMRQAENILKFGIRRNPAASFFQQENLGIYSILEGALENHSAYELCHPDVLALADIDKENQTEYLKTLFRYLLCDRNASRAAQALYVHRNTVNQRLEKIREHLTCDLENGETRVYLILSAMLLTLEEQKTGLQDPSGKSSAD